jgi:hypothetical protein
MRAFPTGDAVQVDPDRHLRIPSQEILPLRERDLAVSPDDAAMESGFRRTGRRARDLGCLTTEGVTKPVDRPNEAGIFRPIAEAFPKLPNQARQAPFRDERVGPELILQLVFREGLRPGGQEKLEQPVRLRLDVHGLSTARELARVRVERAVTELNAHRHPEQKRNKPGTESGDSAY